MSELNDIVQTGLKVAGDPHRFDEYRQALISAGIKPDAAVEAPDPGPQLTPIGLEDVVVEQSTHEGVERESAPMRFLRFWIQDGGGKYPGYKTFALIDVWHPRIGRQWLTHSYERNDGSLTPIGDWITHTLKRGDVFQVGRIKVDKGHMYKPITVNA